MNWKSWAWAAAVVLGALALMAIVWWAGPLIGFGDARPFEAAWLRGLVCVLVALAAAGAIGWRWWRRRAASRALEDGLTAQAAESGDGERLAERMKEALASLRKSRGRKGDALYDLPWYVIIGPPGAGKTTALVNSGLKFPLSRGRPPEAVSGIGGTRYCDWWFTEDAVLIDTAGRYTTQDSDAKADRASWLSFLGLLHKNRPRQPINGVLVAISLEDLLIGTPEEIEAHATAIRARLQELHEILKIDFPVYAVFTKADLVAGFSEFFGHLSEADRQMVWGHTFQTADKTRNMVGEVAPEFDALVERLNEWLPDRLQDEPSPTARVVLFGFPSQMAAARGKVVDFLARIFEPSRYDVHATLRGFYFTSGTQEGTPIDQLIGALSRSFGSEDVGAAALSGRGRSFFLTDLLLKVVKGESGWVSTNRAAVRRLNVMRLATYAGLALVCAVMLALWSTSYLRNEQLIGLTNTLLAKYRGEATETLRESVVADRNFSKVLPLLNTLRFMPTGYASREEPAPVLATFGLSQRPRLRSAAETAYHAGLERMFRSRLIFRLEEQLEANRANPGFIYEGLKVYLMLGGRPEAPIDRELILNWMRRDWAENLYPGAGFARGRQLLEDHLVAMLDLDNGSPPLVSVNGSLVEDSQRTLARLSVAERAYELLKSDARGGAARDWTVVRAGGPDAALVFDTAGGDLDNLRVPFFFTYDGFLHAFLDRFGDVADAVDRDRWVLGATGQQQAYTAQYGSLFGDLLKLYARDFTPAWTGTLGRLKLRPLTADKPRYVALQAISAPISPLRQIIESIRDETRLTRERPAGKPAAGADPRAAAVKGALGNAAAREAEARAGAILPSSLATAAGTIGRGALAGSGAGGGGDRFAIPTAEAPGAGIEAAFKPFHLLLDGEAGRRAIDTLIQNLNELKNSAIQATNPNEAQQANLAIVGQTRALRALASRFPQPFEGMLRQVAGEFEGSAAGAAVAQLNQAFADQVARDCQQLAANRFPFFKASERDIPFADFAKLFAPGSVFDRFVKENLGPYIDRSKPQWSWRTDNQVARSFSAASLREFQRASDIRDVFFGGGGNMPALTLAVTPLTLTGDAQRAKLDVNGSPVATQQGINTASTVQWPGAASPGRTTLVIEGASGGFFGGATPPSVLADKQGPWSLFRLLDTGSILKQGDDVVATLTAGGRELSYRFSASTSQNPLALPALREFRCPTGL